MRLKVRASDVHPYFDDAEFITEQLLRLRLLLYNTLRCAMEHLVKDFLLLEIRFSFQALVIEIFIRCLL